jgi:protein gp37
MDAEWVRSILRQCRRARIPFFFKQWGGVRKGETGRELDGQTLDEFPPIAEKIVPDRKTRLALVAALGL